MTLVQVLYVLAVVVQGEAGPKVAEELSRHATWGACLRAQAAASAPGTGPEGQVACVKRTVRVKEGR